jgi:predicted transcriptional regulator YdeE/DNA-binding transcriptional MerR regulator
MLKIGEFSKIAQVSPKTLRLYDQRGLLKPAWIDRFTGYRYYRVAQLAELNRILAFKDLGFSLEQIALLQQDDLPPAELRGMIRLQQAELAQHIQEEQARLARLEARLAQIENAPADPAYQVVLKSIPPARVASIRDQVPPLGGIEPLISELSAYLQQQGIALNPPAAPLALFHDLVYREGVMDIEVALPVAKKTSANGRVQVRQLPAVQTMACVLHHGRYRQLREAYHALVQWADSSGYLIYGPNRELYLQRAAPGAATDALTEIQLPIKPKPYLSFVPSIKEQKRMEIKIVSKPAFNVAGLKYFGKNEQGEIAQMWQELFPRYEEIKQPIDPQICYGVCGDMVEDGRFHYLAGCQVQPGSEQPQDMETWAVPEQTYAVFPCTLQNIPQTYEYAFQTWLPQSDYEHVPGPDFEYYDEDFNPQEGTGLYIYIPVRKKE